MKKNLLSVCLITLSITCFAQEKYSIIGYVGRCDLRFIHPVDLLYPGDEYSTSISYKAGIYYDFLSKKQKTFYPTIGLSLTGKTAVNRFGINAFPPQGVTIDKFLTLDLPVVLNYQITRWLKLKGGMNGSSLIMTTNYHGPTERQFFTYGYLIGLSLKYRQYSLNLEYIRDFNDMLRHVLIDNASYRCSLIHIGIGYHFHSFKQFRGMIN
jgi:hypothetical protein